MSAALSQRVADTLLEENDIKGIKMNDSKKLCKDFFQHWTLPTDPCYCTKKDVIQPWRGGLALEGHEFMKVRKSVKEVECNKRKLIKKIAKGEIGQLYYHH